MYKYFRANVRENGEADENSIVEITAPIHYIYMPFFIGIFIGCLLMKVFG